MENDIKIQLRGLIRFSYLAESGFALSEKGAQTVRDTLYDENRLMRRFALFETLTLPSLMAQTDPDYKIGILIAHDFPADAKAHLKSLIAPLPQAQIVGLAPMQHFQAIKKGLRRIAGDAGASHTLTFRLDDDDAMHRTTVARMRQIAIREMAVRDASARLVIGFNRGFYFAPGAKKNRLSEHYERTPLGIGLGLVEPLGKGDTIFRRNHRHLSQYYDTYTEVTTPMFVRSVHQDNDSGARPSGRKGKMTEPEIEQALETDFGLSLDQVRAL